MTLKERYHKETTNTLVQIIESQQDYTNECVVVVLDEIARRPVSDDEVKELATAIVKDKVMSILKNFDPYNDKLVPPRSTYLTTEEVLLLLKEEFSKWMERKETFDFDVWKYAIGGIL